MVSKMKFGYPYPYAVAVYHEGTLPRVPKISLGREFGNHKSKMAVFKGESLIQIIQIPRISREGLRINMSIWWRFQ